MSIPILILLYYYTVLLDTMAQNQNLPDDTRTNSNNKIFISGSVFIFAVIIICCYITHRTSWKHQLVGSRRNSWTVSNASANIWSTTECNEGNAEPPPSYESVVIESEMPPPSYESVISSTSRKRDSDNRIGRTATCSRSPVAVGDNGRSFVCEIIHI